MKIEATYTSTDRSTPGDKQRGEQLALQSIARRAEALGADLTPDDVTETVYTVPEGRKATYTAEVPVVPDAALEAAGRAYYDRIGRAETVRHRRGGPAFKWTPWEQLDRLHRAMIIREAQEIAEAAYPATRAAWLRDAADELEDEAVTRPKYLARAWKADAQHLDGTR